MTTEPPVLMADSPVMFVGGPYSNREATEAAVNAARSLGIPPRQVVCTGDVVAYGADPAATVDLVREAGWWVVKGNCEENLAAGALDCGCGFPAGSACERLSTSWFAHAAASLDKDALAWMGVLPRRIDVVIGGNRLAVIHGGASRIAEYIFASTEASTKLEQILSLGCDGVVAGHCGLPFTQVIADKLWHNAGAIGMPANDGTPRTWYSVISPTSEGLTIDHRALEYDFQAAAGRMRSSGLPFSYADALEIGLWPSCDVLLLQEIRERGKPLAEGRTSWTHAAEEKKARKATSRHQWPHASVEVDDPIRPEKFKDPDLTLAGQPRAKIEMSRLRTLWFNTGTLCNIACRNCYIESSPTNDRLAYLTRAELVAYLDEIEREKLGTEELGFTGGEPFLNADLPGMLEDGLSRGFRVLVLTNAMRPMRRHEARLLDLNQRFRGDLTIRVSLDHFTKERHEDERGAGTFQPTLDGLIRLVRNGFKVTVAGRTMWNEDPVAERAGYAALFRQHQLPIDANDPTALVLFPEMDPNADVPEITEGCWSTLHRSPNDVMCATSRMVVKRRGAAAPTVVACTLIPYDDRFDLGPTLRSASATISLNHPFCASFCVLGGSSCSRAS